MRMAALNKILRNNRSMGKRFAWMSSVSPVVVLSAPVIVLAALRWVERSLLVIATEPVVLL